MFHIAICDDENIFAKKIASVLDEYLKTRKLSYKIDIYHSGKELVELGIGVLRYKVVFLDINMEELDGIEAAKHIRTLSDKIFIVFVTAYINYAPEGYKLDAVRYLLKDGNMFRESVFECMDTVFAKMNYAISKKCIHFNEGKKEVYLSNILYIESKLHKLLFYILEDEHICEYSMYDTLNHIEAEYTICRFVRIHQSFLVNMRHIAKMKRYEVLLTNGDSLSIAKVRYKDVEDAYIAYKGDM